MKEQRKKRYRRFILDLFAVIMLGVWAAVITAVLSADLRDPPTPFVHPGYPTARNLLGLPGAWVNAKLVTYFGLAVLPLLGAWYVAAWSMLLERRHGKWSCRLLGWLLLVPATALLTHLVATSIAGWPVHTGPGGQLGMMLHQYVLTQIPPNLYLLAAGKLFTLSLVLAFDWCWPLVMRILVVCWSARTTVTTPVLAAFQARPMKLGVFAESLPGSIPIKHPDTPLTKPAKQPTLVDDTDEHPVVATLSIKSLLGLKSELKEKPVPVSRPISEHSADEVWKPTEGEYVLPPMEVLEDPEPPPYDQPEHEQRLRDRAARLEQIFADFGLNVRVVGINTGPVITQFEIALETGLRLSRVTSLADDLALKLKVAAVRVVAPLPGKDTVGIEIPNDSRSVVKLKEVILTGGAKLQKYKLPLFLGRDTEGQPLVYDLAEMPHLLIAGRTGTGKSVCMNTIVLSLLMTRRPDQVRMIMIDPKMLEMSEYGKVPHLMHPVVNNMKKAEAILSWAVDKMDERYDLLMRARVRSIAAYNELSPEEIYRRVKPADDDEKARVPERMPYIVLFIDEFADLMMQNRKEVEGHIIRLAQKSRAAGIHLVIATQKPTVDVVTGLIKSNLPARICFQVASRTDSRVVLDEMGAEKLLGKGDMLFLQPGTSTIVRGQGTYASDRDIAQVVGNLETDQPAYARELIQLNTAGNKRGALDEGDGNFLERLRERDDVYPEALEIIIREQRGSVSLLQRALGIGYGRGARLIDFMAEDGFVGPYNGSNAREVLLKSEQWEAMKAGETLEV
jgi:S-DNA-T family DNA segregation ATPase FtsK/SpoIIIE